MIKSKKQMYLVIGAFALVLMLGTVTYAFFNYTRTGSANIIKTGRISFNSEQGTSINLTNVFPIDVTNGIPNNNANVGSVTIQVTGDTTYGDGLEYLVTAVNVTNTVGNKSLPISIDVSVTSNTYGEEPNQTTTTLGTADSDYFTHHGPNAETSIYKVLAGETITNNDDLLVGYIKSGVTGVDGNIVIRAYIDASKVAISDTYPERTVRTVKTTGYDSEACETALTGASNVTPATVCATASDLQAAIDGEDLTDAQISALVSAGIVEEYTDGTTSTWVGDRTVFTTSEWNSLQANGVSFQVKVEANESIWVVEPVEPVIPGTIPSCSGCYFTFGSGNHGAYASLSNNDTNDTLEEVIASYGASTDYRTIVEDSGKNYFIGFTTTTNGLIDKAYACGIKENNPNQGTPFCIEYSDNQAIQNSNMSSLTDLYGSYDSETETGCNAENGNFYCTDQGTVNAIANPEYGVAVGEYAEYWEYSCYIYYEIFSCE